MSASRTSPYWRHNAVADEGERLRLLESVADARSQRLLAEAGVSPGWSCAELGAGAGSIARWLAEQVGPQGFVLALDSDVTLLTHLQVPQVTVLQADVTVSDLGAESFDLVHTRNLLMHLDEPEVALQAIVKALRPGGVVVLEEGDGFPIAAATSAVFRKTLSPLADRWTWARQLPVIADRLGLADLEVFVETEMLQGGTSLAAFWYHTLQGARAVLLQDARYNVMDTDIDATLTLLADESFWSPFMAVVCLTARKPC